MTEEIMEGQVSMFDLGIWSGKMLPELSVPTVEKISEPSSKKRQKSFKGMPLFLDLRRANGSQPEQSWETDGASLGEHMMHNIGECHSVENGCVCYVTSTETPQRKYYLTFGEKPRIPVVTKLSEILEENPNPKYQLSARACQGILNRANRRGKQLPEILEKALKCQIAGSEDACMTETK